MRADARRNREHLLVVARDLVEADGIDVTLSDIARKAGVGMATLYRHFPTRETLLEALFRVNFDELKAKADVLLREESPAEALVAWLKEALAMARIYSGAIAPIAAALADESSALHVSCVAMKAAGTRLLARAQDAGEARKDLNGTDLFALVGALAWIHDRPSFSPRSGHLFNVISSAILVRP